MKTIRVTQQTSHPLHLVTFVTVFYFPVPEHLPTDTYPPPRHGSSTEKPEPTAHKWPNYWIITGIQMSWFKRAQEPPPPTVITCTAPAGPYFAAWTASSLLEGQQLHLTGLRRATGAGKMELSSPGGEIGRFMFSLINSQQYFQPI